MASSGLSVDLIPGHSTYRYVRSLSSGSFGVVALYQHVSGEKAAIKFLTRGEEVSKYVEQEAINHRWLRHPHVVRFKQLFLTERHICIAMEYADGGNLFQHVQSKRQLSESASRWFFQQIIFALDYCHRKGKVKPAICNRDIKLENILLQTVKDHPTRPLVKLCDFGYSKSDVVSAPRSMVGTLVYMAPEVVQEKRQQYDGLKADVWSCGVMLYIMLAGQYPFDSIGHRGDKEVHTKEVIQRIKEAKWEMPSNVSISPSCHDLLSKMLEADSDKRLSVASILQHPWFLQDLPPAALRINEEYLSVDDYSDVQSQDEIKAILEQAKEANDQMDDLLIDEAMLNDPHNSD